jgi:hypothetical protein
LVLVVTLFLVFVVFSPVHSKQRNLGLVLTLALAGLCSVRAEGSAAPLYILPELSGAPIDGWTKPKGYAGPQLMLEDPSNAANSLPAIVLDSHRWWNEASVDTTTDSEVIGDLGVAYDKNSSYVLSFHFARYGTAPHLGADKDSPFFGALAYQIWAGHPEKGGVLLAANASPAVTQVTISENQRIKLVVPAGMTAQGNIHVRFMSRWSDPSSDFNRAIYQQAEISMLRLDKAL